MYKIAALFVDKDGPYAGLDGIDLWDVSRDARKYNGPYSVVAHPPCNRWGKLAPVNLARWGTPIGEDGGCFASALKSVRKYGGVLEHPAHSIAYKKFNLPTPTGFVGWKWVGNNEYVGEVWQSDYGHKATKKTWLYCCSNALPKPFLTTKTRGTHQIGGGVNTGYRSLPRMKQSETHITPKPFLNYLLSLAMQCR